MPASSVVGIHEAISEALRGSIQETSLEEKLVAASKKVLLTKIDFEKAGQQFSHLQDLRMKYKPINTGEGSDAFSVGKQKDKMAGKDSGEEALLKPRRVLYPPEKLKLQWSQVFRVGAGLENAGNTCFLNSVLQCLTYTPPLTHHLLSGEHSQQCRVVGFCILCDIQNHMKRALSHSGHVIRPQMIIARLRQIAKHFRFGRQEDAHEFLRYVLDVAQKNCLSALPKDLDRFSRETTVVDQIFGGYHRSQVQCLKCKAKSNTFDHFLDVSLDIKVANSVQKALERFVQPELLQKENAYDCRHCNCRVTAQKHFTIFKVPTVLTLQLKRFEFTRFDGRKIHDIVHYPEVLDVRPYMSRRDGGPVWYKLYAIVCHSGGGIHSGHYYAYAKAPNGIWHVFNDTIVREVKNANSVLNRPEAYLLFYVRQPEKIQIESHNKSKFIGPQLPRNLTINEAAKISRTQGVTNDVGIPISKQSLIPPKGTSVQENTVKVAESCLKSPSTFSVPNSIALMSSKVVSPSYSATNEKTSISSAKQQSEIFKPRIVMQIKRGKVVVNTSANSTQSASKQNRFSKYNPLVPYAEMSSSENDSDAENRAVQRKLKSAESAVNAISKEFQALRELNMKVLDPHSGYAKVSLGVKQSGNVQASMKASQVVDETVTSAKKKDEFGSPVKSVSRGLSSPLTLQQPSNLCSPLRNSTTIKATSQWIVTDQNLVSPSSQGSNNSINSTTEWTVSEETKTGRKVVNRLSSVTTGWTVECNGKTENSKRDAVQDSRNPETLCKETNGHQSELTEEKSGEVNTNKAKSSVKHGGVHANLVCEVGDGTLGLHSNSKQVKLGNSNNWKETEEVRLHERKNSGGDTAIQDHVDSHKKHKRKKRKHDASDSSSDADIGKIHKRKHKKKGHQELSPDRPTLNTGEVSTAGHADSDDKLMFGKKKHKKHKKKHQKEKEHKKKKQDSEEDDEDAFEVQWVEKTKETVIGDHKKTEDKFGYNSESVTHAPTYAWDACIKESLTVSALDKDKRPQMNTWHGTANQSSHSIEELINQSSRGYGAGVSSWDGGASHVNKDIQREVMEGKIKQRYEDDYDEEFDAGKTKKNKKHSKETAELRGENPFQKLAMQKQQQNSQSLKSEFRQTSDNYYDHHNYSNHGNNGCYYKSSFRNGYHGNRRQHTGSVYSRSRHGGFVGRNSCRISNSNSFHGSNYHNYGRFHHNSQQHRK